MRSVSMSASFLAWDIPIKTFSITKSTLGRGVYVCVCVCVCGGGGKGEVGSRGWGGAEGLMGGN